jgi:hypothetical protein
MKGKHGSGLLMKFGGDAVEDAGSSLRGQADSEGDFLLHLAVCIAPDVLGDKFRESRDCR